MGIEPIPRRKLQASIIDSASARAKKPSLSGTENVDVRSRVGKFEQLIQEETAKAKASRHEPKRAPAVAHKSLFGDRTPSIAANTPLPKTIATKKEIFASKSSPAPVKQKTPKGLKALKEHSEHSLPGAKSRPDDLDIINILAPKTKGFTPEATSTQKSFLSSQKQNPAPISQKKAKQSLSSPELPPSPTKKPPNDLNPFWK